MFRRTIFYNSKWLLDKHVIEGYHPLSGASDVSPLISTHWETNFLKHTFEAIPNSMNMPLVTYDGKVLLLVAN